MLHSGKPMSSLGPSPSALRCCRQGKLSHSESVILASPRDTYSCAAALFKCPGCLPDYRRAVGRSRCAYMYPHARLWLEH